MSGHNDPKAITICEAFAQLSAAVWDLIGVLFDWWPKVHRHAELRWSEALTNAVEYRADLVGRRQAEHDYFLEGSG